MMLYFRFVMKIRVITHQCTNFFSGRKAVLVQIQGNIRFSHCPASMELGWTGSWEETQ